MANPTTVPLKLLEFELHDYLANNVTPKVREASDIERVLADPRVVRKLESFGKEYQTHMVVEAGEDKFKEAFKELGVNPAMQHVTNRTAEAVLRSPLARQNPEKAAEIREGMSASQVTDAQISRAVFGGDGNKFDEALPAALTKTTKIPTPQELATKAYIEMTSQQSESQSVGLGR